MFSKSKSIIYAYVCVVTFTMAEAQSTLTSEQYGFYHNEGLSLFFDKNPDYSFSTFSQLGAE